MQEEQRHVAKGQLTALMQAGHPWHEAAAMAGVQIGRSAAYQLLCNVRLRGNADSLPSRNSQPDKAPSTLLCFARQHCLH
jgi:hypothetical protein